MEAVVDQSFTVLLELSRICKCMFMPSVLTKNSDLLVFGAYFSIIATLFLASLLSHELELI